MSSDEPKALSGATLGMRFMQRKTPRKPSETSKSPAKLTSPVTSPQYIEQSHDPSIPLVANSSDMYGISAEIIGRRSFNSFRKSIEETWVAALGSMSKSRFDSRVEKEQITDKELLKRYEQYVKGHGDMVDAKTRIVGNLNKKKRKR